MPANTQKGETSLMINGEERIIRFSLDAQSRIIDALGLDGIEQIPQLMRKLDANVFATMIHAALVDSNMTLEDVKSASIPMMPAQRAIVQAINLAMWGNINGPDPTQEEVKQAEKIASGGASATH